AGPGRGPRRRPGARGLQSAHHGRHPRSLRATPAARLGRSPPRPGASACPPDRAGRCERRGSPAPSRESGASPAPAGAGSRRAGQENGSTLMGSFTLALVTFLAFATYAGSATAQSAVPAPPGNGAAKPMITLQMPPIPDPVPVRLKPASTALLVFDVVEPICASRPNCLKTMVPAISGLLARAQSRH